MALADPAVVERDLAAERADVDELLAVRREAERVLAHQERPLADRTGPRDVGLRDPHGTAIITVAASFHRLWTTRATRG